MLAENKRGKPERETYCRVELHPSIKNQHYLSNSFGNQQQTNYLYTEGEFENWTVGFLKNYLSTVNNYLDKGYERWLFASQTENAGLEALATNTLYVPDYCLTRYKPLMAEEGEAFQTTKLMKSYPYTYEVMRAEEISKKILESQDDFYYLTYVRSGTHKFITVFNGKTGTILYSNYVPMSYNIKKSDFKALAGSIKVVSKRKMKQ